MITPATLRPLGGLAVLCGLLFARLPAAEPQVFHHENVLGTSLEIRVRAASAEDARKAESAVLREIDRLNAIFSTYTPDSEFSRWQRTQNQAVPVSAELFEVMFLSEVWRQKTEGAFNPGAALFTEIWRAAALRGNEPTAAELSVAAGRINRPAWQLDKAAQTAVRQADYPVTLDAVAKGYIVEHAGRAGLAAVPSITSLVVNIGGDLRIWGDESYPVAITNPFQAADNGVPSETIALHGAALATSGGYRRGVAVAGKSYSHILDARTGRPVDAIASSSVVAPDAALADLLATAFSVLDPTESARLAASVPGVGFLVIKADGSRALSPLWPGSEGKGAPVAASGADAGSWADQFELLVNFEVAAPTNNLRYARPYVAVWIENEEGRSVRTLLVWYDRPRWLAELRRWSRADTLRARTDLTDVLAISSDATRPPGRYYLVWNGLDDRKRPVPAGTYIVLIESAREHGTHQLMEETVTVGAAPFKVELSRNVEISAASLEYRRRDSGK